jgi:glycosyltransferase involved in cell wall biosynthesis
MENEIELSVVVLAYKSESFIQALVDQLLDEIKGLGVTFELVVVANYDNDGQDNTPQVVKKLYGSNPSVVIVSKAKQGRMGWDMRSGFEAARGKYISVIDGDGQMPTSDIPVVYNIIKTGLFDVVTTYRVKRFDGFYRSILSRIYNVLFRLLFNPSFPVNDVNSKPKIIKADIIKAMNLKSSDWFTDAEIMIRAIEMKLKICQVATVFYKNERRKSLVSVYTIFEFVYNLVYYKFFIK